MKRGRILLMVPLTSLVKRAPLFPDLGLGYLASAVKNSGHDVSVQSWNMDFSEKGFCRYLEENKFDVIGIKVFTKDVAAANRTIKLARSALPDALILVGGPHPSTSEPIDIMEDFRGCDFAIRGEAETALPLLIEYVIKNGRQFSDGIENIPGLVWESEGMTRSNKPFLAADIDGLGFPLWEIMHPKDYRAPKIPGATQKGNSAPIIVTRGCSASCTYCAAFKISGKVVRSRSSDSVLEEIKMLYNEYNVRHLFFMDTRFMQKTDIVAEICEGLLGMEMDIAWDCIGYEDLNVFNEKILQLMNKAGCKFINMGIESGSEQTRKRIKKAGELSEILNKIKLVKSIGIGIRAFFMIGFYGETIDDIKETTDFAFSLPADIVQFEIACPHPGTELLNSLKTKYKINRIDWECFDVYRSPYPLSEVASGELYRILKQIRRKNMFLSLKKRIDALRNKEIYNKL